MRIFSKVMPLAFGFFFLCSTFLQAAYPINPAEFGVIKSGNKSMYLGCEVKEEDRKFCTFFLEEKGQKKEALTGEFLLVKKTAFTTDALKRISREISAEDFSPYILIPLTTLTIGLSAIKGPAFMSLLVFSPLDLAAGPIYLTYFGIHRLYKIIQGAYLKKAWKTMVGLRDKKFMRLSKGDFKELLKTVRAL